MHRSIVLPEKFLLSFHPAKPYFHSKTISMNLFEIQPQSPIYRLADDVLLQIFQLLYRIHLEEWAPAPWTLSVVCRKWRDIALMSPSLWRKSPFQNEIWTEATAITANYRTIMPSNERSVIFFSSRGPVRVRYS